MILTPILGAMAFSQESRGEKRSWDRKGAFGSGRRDVCGLWARHCVRVFKF